MHKISQHIASYLNARAAILRVLDDKNLKAPNLVNQMPLSIHILRRKLKTADWRADELGQLGKILGVTANLEIHLRLLNEQLLTLPEKDWKHLVHETHIGQQRMRSLMNDCCIWRDSELFQVSNFVRTYVPTTTN